MAFYPFKPCRACVGDEPVGTSASAGSKESDPILMYSAPLGSAAGGTKDIFPVDTEALPGKDSEADPVKLIPATEKKDESFLTTPAGAVVSVGAVALFVGYLMSNMGTTRGSPRLT